MTKLRRTIAIPWVNLMMLCLALSTAGAFIPLRAQDISELQRINQRINEAERMATTGDPAKAAAALRDLLEHHKNYGTLWYYLGVALSREGDLENARKAFKKGLDGNPFFGRIALARTDLLAKQFQQAEKEGRRVLGKEAKTANAHYVFAILHFFSGDPDDALTEIEASIKEDPSFAPALLLKYQTFLLRLVTKTGPPEIDRTERTRQLMKEAAQSLQAYLALNPAEQNNDFLLDQLHAINVYAESVPDLSSPEHLFSLKEVTTKARVLRKPEPQYTDQARAAQISGSVVLRVVFSASGSVEHILVVKPLPFGLTEEGIKAAKQIKFTPATKDGKPVSMYMQLEYNFNLY